MKKTVKMALLGLSMVAVMSISASDVYAEGDRAYEKLKSEVSDASPDDWMVYAKSAQKLIRKKDHLTEAKEWITKSLEISETAYNREVFGDYYMANNLPKEAFEQYMKSMQLAKEANPDRNFGAIQEKIIKAKQKALNN